MTADAPTILATSMGFNRAHDPWQPGPVFDYAFQLAGNPPHPRLCFIATANGDQAQSIRNFYEAFSGSSVRTSHLALFDKPNIGDVRAHLLAQDAIWIDRGSVANLLAVWRVHRLDGILRECWQAGVILGGESAGSLCWHTGGTTDSFGQTREILGGLGFLPYSNAVHYKDRGELYRNLIAQGTLRAGYATDAGAGLHYRGSELVQAVADRNRAGAYWIERNADGSVREERIEPRRLPVRRSRYEANRRC
jgi:peptidase E